jgi:uncharacterized membrane protein
MVQTQNLFEGGVLGSKVLIMALLFILSLVNAYTKFISSQPRKFLTEAALVGLASAISFAFIASARYVETAQIFNISILAFLVFFVFHIFMEMSGMNQGAVDKSKLGGKMQKQQKVLTSTPVKGILIVIGAIMVILAMINTDFSDQYGQGLSVAQVGLEGLVFGVLNALPTVMISLDRGEKNGKKIAKDTGIMGAAFFAGHILLQLGGFYSSAFAR